MVIVVILELFHGALGPDCLDLNIQETTQIYAGLTLVVSLAVYIIQAWQMLFKWRQPVLKQAWQLSSSVVWDDCRINKL